MKNHWSVVVLFLISAVLTTNAEALILAGWDVEGIELDEESGVVSNVAPYTFYATTSEVSHVQAWLSLGAGVNPSTSADQYGFKISSGDQTNSLAGAVLLDHYMEFSITVDDGYQLNFTSIEMAGGGSGTGCSNVVLMTSVDGFTAGAEIASAFPANSDAGLDTDASGFGGPIDLSSSAYQNLTDTISFRLYGWNSSSGAGTTRIRNLSGDDLVLLGDVLSVSSNAGPELSILTSNETMSVAVEVAPDSTASYVLQYVGDLGDTNGWSTVTSPFDVSTNWTVETTNTSAFYRVTAE
jgi:hypothetical protein